MNHESNVGRRRFLAAAGAGLAAAGLGTPALAAGKRGIRKTLKYGMIKTEGGPEEKLASAKAAGFDGVEPDTMTDDAQVAAMKTAAANAGILIDAVVCNKHWSHPLSEPDMAKAQVCIDATITTIDNAKALGGDMILLVPAVVRPGVNYTDAWERSHDRIGEHILPHAEKAGITIGIENVWNKFLLTAPDMRRYVEDFKSERVRTWIDVGNMVMFGFPENWIGTLSDTIARVDIKDFHTGSRDFTELKKGSVNWRNVMKAFDEIGYEGWFAAEVQGGDTDYLRDVVAAPMDEFINL